MLRVRRFVLFVCLALLLALALAAAAQAARPTRVLLISMDQMRPEYAKQYNMKNVLWLQKQGAHFPKAIVGDMTAETVISHNVMVSGLFPKNMGWTDEWMRDTTDLFGYGENALVTTGDLSYAQFEQLIEKAGYLKLGDYLHSKFPGTIVACVGEKSYQVESMAASNADYWVRMGSRRTTASLPDDIEAALPWSGNYRGVGGNAPAYIADNPRYIFSAGNPWDTYGTDVTPPAWMYPEDGRYVLGFPGHESGDQWVADAAMDIMKNEKWSGLFLNFGAIDKAGHMWGGGSVDNLKNYSWTPGDVLEQVHLAWAAKQADAQLGRIIARLKALGQFKQTLIVITADHGTQDASNGFYGVNVYDGGMQHNWYLGTSPNGGYSGGGNPVLAALEANPNIAANYQSTYISSWLKNTSEAKKLEIARIHKRLPGVIATYVKRESGKVYKKCGGKYKVVKKGKLRYDLVFTNKMTKAEKAWWKRHAQDLVNTMASAEAPEVVSLLKDRVSYGSWGDHGGAQQSVQRIPMVFYAPGIRSFTSHSEARLVDVMPTILRTLGVKHVKKVDGRAYTLKVK